MCLTNENKSETETIFMPCFEPTESICFLDHTWVETENPQDRFHCIGTFSQPGGDNKGDTHAEYTATRTDYNIAAYCRGKHDASFVHPYGIDGVCHQMANRFLYPTGHTLYLNENRRPRGYLMSSLAYGTWGHSFRNWRSGIYNEAVEKYGEPSRLTKPMTKWSVLYYEIEKLYLTAAPDADKTELLVEETRLMLVAHIEGLTKNPIEKDQVDYIRDLYNFARMREIVVDGGEMRRFKRKEIEDTFDTVNALGVELQCALRDTIGAKEYTALNGGDFLFELVDIERAVAVYAGE